MHIPRDSKGRYIKIRNNIETKTPTTKLLTPEVQERRIDSSLGKISRQAQSSQSIKLGKESLEWTKEFSVLWKEEMDPNNNEEIRERLEKEAREVLEKARLEGEMLRREAERKAKEDEDRGSNNEENDEELTFGFPLYDIPATFGRE